jgi:hypothetical protein
VHTAASCELPDVAGAGRRCGRGMEKLRVPFPQWDRPAVSGVGLGSFEAGATRKMAPLAVLKMSEGSYLWWLSGCQKGCVCASETARGLR